MMASFDPPVSVVLFSQDRMSEGGRMANESGVPAVVDLHGKGICRPCELSALEPGMYFLPPVRRAA
jgi:hypothetical protein